MTELMKLYLQIRAQNPELSDSIVRQQAKIFFFMKKSPFFLNSRDKDYLENITLSSGISGELTYVAPSNKPVDSSINNYVEDGYIDEYFE